MRMKTKALGLVLSLALGLVAPRQLLGLDLSLSPRIEGGISSSSASFLAERGAFYAEIGADSFADPGSWARSDILPGYGLGLDLCIENGPAFPFKSPLSLNAGVELGLWGSGVVTGYTASKKAFAWVAASAIALAIHADLRYTLKLRDYDLYVEAGPLVGTALAYSVTESVSGIESRSLLLASLEDFGFIGLGGGIGGYYRLKSLRLGFDIRGEYALTPLARGSGSLGSGLEASWRALGGLLCLIPLGGRL